MRQLVAILFVALLLAGCERTPVSVGSKDAVQDRIVAEMMARMIEAHGLAVERRTGLGDSADVFQALRAGSIDVYPEYTGTALAVLGAPPDTDRAEGRERLAGPFSELGLKFLEPFGFESTYSVVTRRALAQSEEIAGVGDLADRAGRLRLGVSRQYAERSRDGLAPFLEHFGLNFAEIVTVAEDRREDLYAMLMEERIDLMIGFSTDPQIADFGFVTLAMEPPFFPAYEATPLTSAAALERHPQLASALAPLAGRLDAARLRNHVRQVQVGGRTPRAVAAIALAELGLVDVAGAPPEIPLAIALDPQEIGTEPANRALDAVRTAMPGRAVALAESGAPLLGLARGETRMAIVPGAAHYRLTPEGVVRDESVEAIGVVGHSVLYAIARAGGPSRLGTARMVATGPEGSPSHTIASVLARHGPAEVELAPQADSGAEAIGAAIKTGEADAGLVIASRQRADVVELLRAESDMKLVDAAAWWQGSVRLALPFLGQATLQPNSYPGLDQSVTALSMQMVLTGPAPGDDQILGRQGPSSFDTRVAPLSDATVRAIDEALGIRPDIGANLRAAAAVSPRPPEMPSARNPRPTQALLSAGIFAYLVFAGWLLMRRKPEGQ